MDYSNNKITDTIWINADILFVTLIILLISISFSFGMLSIFGDTKVASILSRYVIGLSAIFVPILWLNKKYKLSKGVLGLRKANLSILHYLAIVIFAGLCYVIVSAVEPTNFMPITQKIGHSYLNIILLPLSFYSFATIVLSPISEEIFWRGFVYGYLRKKLGVICGLLLQALMFCLLHYNINGNISTNIFVVINAFLVGLISGLIYEKTGSIYPSMLFHCSFNYVSVINIAIHK